MQPTRLKCLMTHVPNQRVKIVTDPLAIEMLLSMTKAQYLEPFFSPMTVTDAARTLGTKVNTLYRWVQAWCELGLLEVTHTMPKRGRPIKLYKTTADEFFIPFASSSATTQEDLFRELNQDFDAEFARALAGVRAEISPQWGYKIALAANGKVKRSPYKTPHERFDYLALTMPAAISVTNTDLYLTEEEAKALQHLLHNVWAPRDRRGGTKRYLIQFRLAPAPR